MQDDEPYLSDSSKLHEYKTMETRLYGELLKTCRRYHSQLSIISIVGILDMVSQEMKELNKADYKMMDDDNLRKREALDPLL